MTTESEQAGQAADVVAAPLTKRANRDTTGRWLPGHGEPGPGNPHQQAITAWRRTLAQKVTVDDIAVVLGQLVKAARDGERWAVTELLDRTLGRPMQHTVIESDGDTPRYKILIGIDEAEL